MVSKSSIPKICSAPLRSEWDAFQKLAIIIYQNKNILPIFIDLLFPIAEPFLFITGISLNPLERKNICSIVLNENNRWLMSGNFLNRALLFIF